MKLSLFINAVAVFPTVGPASIDFIATEDIGRCLLPIFGNPQVFSTKTVPLCADKLIGKKILTILNEELSPMIFFERQVMKVCYAY